MAIGLKLMKINTLIYSVIFIIVITFMVVNEGERIQNGEDVVILKREIKELKSGTLISLKNEFKEIQDDTHMLYERLSIISDRQVDHKHSILTGKAKL